MKQLLNRFFPLLIITILCYTAYNFTGAGQESVTGGTISACWAPYCSVPTGDATIILEDTAGNVLGTCTLATTSSCCTISGNFPTGTYHFVYFQASSTHDCVSIKFNYTAGTDL